MLGFIILTAVLAVAVIVGLVWMFRAFRKDDKTLEQIIAYKAKKGAAELAYFTRENAAAKRD